LPELQFELLLKTSAIQLTDDRVPSSGLRTLENPHCSTFSSQSGEQVDASFRISRVLDPGTSKEVLTFYEVPSGIVPEGMTPVVFPFKFVKKRAPGNQPAPVTPQVSRSRS
ncbi:MAG TPA: hypothetical protein VFV50_04540, partial [Bdellovibrionales bacterium]|nr:hypothetical protein [Bdellovibrionales bacterium]